jgi:hypothetical protein
MDIIREVKQGSKLATLKKALAVSFNELHFPQDSVLENGIFVITPTQKISC